MTLADELRAQGLGIQQGIDRAEELASILSGLGVRTLSDMQFERGYYSYAPNVEGADGQGQWVYQDEGSRVWMPSGGDGNKTWNTTDDASFNGYRLRIGGKDIGHFNIENGKPVYTGDGQDKTALQDSGDGSRNQFAYSAAGRDGTEYYVAGFNPDGTPRLATRMVSSNDDLEVARAAAAYAALVGGAMYAGAGTGGGGIGAGDLLSLPAEGAAGMEGVSSIPSVAQGGGGYATLGTGGLAPLNTTQMPPLQTTGTVSAGQVTSGIPAISQADAAIKAGASVTGTDWGNWADWAKVATSIAGGLSSGDKTQTQSRDPWEEAKPWLRDLMKQGQALQQQYQQNPFNKQQQEGYNGLFGGLNSIGQQMPGLLALSGANASGANNYDRRNPQKALTGAAPFQMPTGLLNFTLPFPRG